MVAGGSGLPSRPARPDLVVRVEESSGPWLCHGTGTTERAAHPRQRRWLTGPGSVPMNARKPGTRHHWRGRRSSGQAPERLDEALGIVLV